MQFAEASRLGPLGIGDESTAQGFEFEVEGGERYHEAGEPPFLSITTDRDGSLRGRAYEFISHPLCGTATGTVVNAFCAASEKFRFTYSSRTSVHIHTNVRDMTCEGIALFLVGCVALEAQLSGMCHERRRNGLFCVPLSVQAGLSQFVAGMAYTLPGWGASAERQRTQPRPKPVLGKYSAVSTNRLWDTGTLEYRVLHGTRDATRILLVAETLRAIKTWASGSTILTAADLFLRDSEEVMHTILGPDLARRVHQANLGGSVVQPPEDCLLVARAALLAAKIAEFDALVRATEVRDAGTNKKLPNPEAAEMIQYGTVPAISSALARMLRDIPVGQDRFGFRREDKNTFLHWFVWTNEVANSSRALVAVYNTNDTYTEEVEFNLED